MDRKANVVSLSKPNHHGWHKYIRVCFAIIDELLEGSISRRSIRMIFKNQQFPVHVNSINIVIVVDHAQFFTPISPQSPNHIWGHHLNLLAHGLLEVFDLLAGEIEYKKIVNVLFGLFVLFV
jgi:hypothetical protein